MLVAVNHLASGECATVMQIEADSESHALVWMDPFQSDEVPVPPKYQHGYPILYLDTRKQVGYCADCAASSGLPLDAHLIEDEEPIPCEECGKDI